MATRILLALVVTLPLVACTTAIGDGAGDGLGRTSPGDRELALVSSSGMVGVLRRGESLAIRSDAMASLTPDTIYRAQVLADDAVLSETDVLTDGSGSVLLSAVMHDVGEEDGAGLLDPGQLLHVRVTDFMGEIRAETVVSLDSAPALQVPGWNVTEVAPPHIFAADAAGAPQNAFAVGGSGGDEVRGPIFLAGDGFPQAAADQGVVDVFVVEDADEWRHRTIPLAGQPGHVAGPIAAAVDAEGRLAVTQVFNPAIGDVGIYDILVDVDRDGSFEWRFNSKDGADGLGKVGFTVQYSESWLRERTSSHLLANIAYDSHGRDGGTWRNDYSASEPVFMYLNPPVMQQYHFAVTKWVVRHQDFQAFWNNPALVDGSCGGVPFSELETRSMEIVTQRGCTNTSPTCFGAMPLEEPAEVTTYDVVFDRDGDGCYDLGEDLLDIVSADAGGDLVSVEQFLALSADHQVGFRVTR